MNSAKLLHQHLDPPSPLQTASVRGLVHSFRSTLAHLPAFRRTTTMLHCPLAIQAFLSSSAKSLQKWYDPRSPATHEFTATARSASSLLIRFAASPHASDGRFTAAQQQWLSDALVGALAIQWHVTTRDGDTANRVLGEELTVYAGCVVCFREVVDVVLIPCRHMLVCEVSCS